MNTQRRIAVMRPSRWESKAEADPRRWGAHAVRQLTLLAGILLVAIGPANADPGPGSEDKKAKSKELAANGIAGAANGVQSPDFLFGAPKGSFAVRAGLTFARAQSEIFEFVTDQLTVEKSDFNAPTIAADLSWRINDRVDAVFGVEYSRASATSEFREFVEDDDLPIVQETHFTQVPVTAGLKLYLTDRGRSVGQYAWVPSSFVPYVGGAAGFVWHQFEQVGDFVDFEDLGIFTDHFISDGWGATFHVFGGADILLNPSLALQLEARYQWADVEMNGGFVGFDAIDLGGLRATAGVAFKF